MTTVNTFSAGTQQASLTQNKGTMKAQIATLSTGSPLKSMLAATQSTDVFFRGKSHSAGAGNTMFGS